MITQVAASLNFIILIFFMSQDLFNVCEKGNQRFITYFQQAKYLKVVLSF